MKLIAFLQVFASWIVYGILLILFGEVYQKHIDIGICILSGLMYLCCNWIRFSSDYLFEKMGWDKKTEDGDCNQQ